ncbi:MAG: hypothetical protein DRI94_11170 [Bacteroidetes bacterium]|nr:MAG: hypothetical protein DRI94_11170 [Bacteroidota bacterium]
MKNFKYIVVILFIVLSAFKLSAQNIIQPEKKSYEDSTGLLYWNKDVPVYLHLSSTPDGQGNLLKSKIHAKYTNPFYFDTEGINYMRTRYAVDTATRKTVNPHIEILWEVYADGKTPVSKVHFKGAKKYSIGNKTYYGKGLHVTISSTDAGSGIENIYYSVNSSRYQKYEHEITPDPNNAVCQLKYYATDKVGNFEDVNKNEVEFFIDEEAPETFHNITNIDLERSIIALNTKIYLNASDAKSGLKTTYYKFDTGPYIQYNGNILPLIQLTEDNHTLSYYSVDKVGNKETPKIFQFFLDKSAPILTSGVLGDRFIVNDKIYFSGRTKLKLTAVDNKSGVKEVKYALDGSEFKKYDQPFYLPKKPGFHIVKYYAVDRMNNNTGVGGSNYKKYKYSTKKIYVDLVGPSLNHSFIGKRFYTRDTVFLGKKSKIKLTASDAESGLQYISYSIDGQQKENMYKEPFSVSGNGNHIIEYFGYDNVNNRNIGRFYVIVDENPPEPAYTFSVKPYKTENGLNVFPSYVMVYLSGVDQMTGTEQIFYSVNGSIEKLYTTPITGFKKGENTLKFKTVDKLGNEKYDEVSFIIE